MESVANKKPCRTCGKNLHIGNPYEFQFECKNCLKYMEFQALCEIRLAEIEDILGEEYSLEKLKEMVDAEKDGRCVVIPCKLHDKVFFIGNGCVEETEVDYFYSFTSERWKLSTHRERMFDHWERYEIDFSEIGKIWTIVNKVDTIYKEKCQVQLLRVVPSTILLFHLVSSFRENYAVS